MAIVYADFITAFPEFANTAVYPESQIDFWLPQAYAQMPASRFGTSLDLAVMLFVAHNIVLSARSARAGSTGGIVGVAEGPTTAKSVGGVSVSYDPGLTATSAAGEYNATSYGQRLYRLIRAASLGSAYFPGPRRRLGLPFLRSY